MLAVLCVVRTAIGFQFQSVAALGPTLVERYQTDYAGLGTLIGMYMLPGIVFAIPGGLIGQRFGDKRVAILGLALMTVGGAWLGIADGYWSAFFSRLVSGVGGVVLNVIMAKMVADWFAGREITVAMAYLLSSWPIG